MILSQKTKKGVGTDSAVLGLTPHCTVNIVRMLLYHGRIEVQ